jgi:predicted ATP-binding protein involved in virulence
MLTSITLENFKGFSRPVTITLRSLTIMFGKNSAGKSTIVQPLHQPNGFQCWLRYGFSPSHRSEPGKIRDISINLKDAKDVRNLISGRQ